MYDKHPTKGQRTLSICLRFRERCNLQWNKRKARVCAFEQALVLSVASNWNTWSSIRICVSYGVNVVHMSILYQIKACQHQTSRRLCLVACGTTCTMTIAQACKHHHCRLAGLTKVGKQVQPNQTKGKLTIYSKGINPKPVNALDYAYVVIRAARKQAKKRGVPLPNRAWFVLALSATKSLDHLPDLSQHNLVIILDVLSRMMSVVANCGLLYCERTDVVVTMKLWW